jgi:hypothetical protein
MDSDNNNIKVNIVIIQMEPTHLDKILEKVTDLYTKYQSDPFMESKMHNYICNQLATTLDNIERNHSERTQRMEDLTAEQFSFIQSFLLHNHYFYHPTIENFFHYDGKNYTQKSEDDVLYHVLSTLSQDRNLISWKHKTKVSIMKRIKDNHIYQTIPESATIQQVLNHLYPRVFSTKVEAKYFLTILGDNILRKDGALIHIVPPSAKNFINNLNALSQIWFGTNSAQSFKFKYHAEHNYSQIRILGAIHGSETILSGLDLLCVACHYSNRYGNSDNYLTKYSNDDAFINSVLYLKNLTPESLIDMFTVEYIRITPGTARITSGNGIVLNEFAFKPTQINWKNMLYLWKHFLESKNLPSVVFTTKLKTRLVELFSNQYDVESDAFNGINSKFLPSVYRFLQFWDETMVSDESEMAELEVGEVVSIFKYWCETRREPTINIGEKQIVDLIMHFYPDTELDADKYIYKMRNTLWDKNLDIQIAMDDFRDKMGVTALNSAYDAYVHYCGYMDRAGPRKRSDGNMTAISLLVSKQYFDKVLLSF